MYNEKIKLGFIEKYTTSDQTKRLLLHIFDGTKDAEAKYGRDFYEMDVEQAQETYNNVAGIKVSGASAILMILKAYVRWCTANGLPTSDSVSRLHIDVRDKLKESHVASPQHLRYALDAAFPHPELNEIEYIYRSFLWLGFMGFQASEAIRVTKDDVHFQDCRIIFVELGEDGTAKEYSHLIYTEAMQDIRMAVQLTEFREPRGKNGIIKQRAHGDEILRGKVGQNSLEDAVDITFRPTISRAFREALDRYTSAGNEVPAQLSLKLTFKHVYMSGIFYRTYERERMGIPPSFDAIVMRERRNAKESKFSRNYTERKLLNILIHDMEQDYDNWKSVFA